METRKSPTLDKGAIPSGQTLRTNIDKKAIENIGNLVYTETPYGGNLALFSGWDRDKNLLTLNCFFKEAINPVTGKEKIIIVRPSFSDITIQDLSRQKKEVAVDAAKVLLDVAKAEKCAIFTEIPWLMKALQVESEKEPLLRRNDKPNFQPLGPD